MKFKKIGFIILTLYGEDGYFVVTDKRRRHIILGAERIAGTQCQVSAASYQGTGQVSRLGRNVQTTGHANTLERLFFLKPLSDGSQDGHLFLSPFDSVTSLFGQG